MIPDQEQVLRHIPGGTTWQAPGPRITSENFKLRAGEKGLSVSGISMTSPADLMKRLGNSKAGSRIAVASVEAIRAIGFDLVADPTPEDPGHAEIREMTARFSERDDRKRLAQLFSLIEPDGTI